MADNKIRMPSSQGGLISFSDDSKSKFELSAMNAVILIIVVAAVLILLHSFGSGLLGI